MKVSDRYKPFDYPITGEFWVSSDVYSLEYDWSKKGIVTVIGETDDTYVTRLLKSEIGFWVGDKVEIKKIRHTHWDT